MWSSCVWSSCAASCVKTSCEDKLCVVKLCVVKLCAAGGGEAGERRKAEVHNQKPEPHTKMWGKCSVDFHGI